MIWVKCKERLPINGQKVWYYGPNIGVWQGNYEIDKTESGQEMREKFGIPVDLFICGEGLGVVDSDDAPYWMPYEDGSERPVPPYDKEPAQ